MSQRALSTPSTRSTPSAPSSTIRPSKWSDVQTSADAAAGGSSGDRLEVEWIYKNRKGKEVFRLMGFESADGRRRVRAAHAVPYGWCAGEGEGPLPLYRLDRLPPRGVVSVCGSEESADWAADVLDLPAITSAFGAGSAGRTDWSPLAGRQVAILPDNDERGRAYAREVAALLLALQPRPMVKSVDLPDLPRGGDLIDFSERCTDELKFDQNQIGPRLREMADKAPLLRPMRNPEGAGPDGAAAAGATAGADTPAEPVLTRMADVAAEQVPWLWPGRVALGKLTLLFGDPGRGKSLLALDLAARVSTGGAWPDGRGSAPAGSVVLVTGEDALADTVRDRLDRAGADVGRVVALEAVRRPPGQGAAPGGAAVERGFTLADWQDLDRAVARLPDTRLVVIDPVSAFLGGSGGQSSAAVRAMLTPIAKMAERRKVAVVLVTHLTKGTGGRAVHRAAGSLAFVAAARSAWLVTADPKDAGRRLLLPAKNNLGDDQGGLAYGIVGGAVKWETEPVKMRADTALAAEGRRGKRGRPAPRQRAAECWLRVRLAAGPVPVGDANAPSPGTLAAEAKAAGWSWRTLRRAGDAIGVAKPYCAQTRRYLWQLPAAPAGKGQNGPESTGPKAAG